MPFVPKLLGEYRECERALFEAEKLLKSGSSNAAALFGLEKTLSADNDAMTMLRNHGEYGRRLADVIEGIIKLRTEREKHFDMPSHMPQLHEPVARKAASAVTAGYTDMILSEDVSSRLSKSKENYYKEQYYKEKYLETQILEDKISYYSK
ncbi:MAG: hypothetical protein V1734_00775 [Nanoarchaeota archaeon]